VSLGAIYALLAYVILGVFLTWQQVAAFQDTDQGITPKKMLSRAGSRP